MFPEPVAVIVTVCGPAGGPFWPSFIPEQPASPAIPALIASSMIIQSILRDLVFARGCFFCSRPRKPTLNPAARR